jgi:hypothetical protein
MTKAELLAAIPDVASLTHVAFLYHYPGYTSLPFCPDGGRTRPKYKSFSDTVIDVLTTLRDGRTGEASAVPLTVDILTCNLTGAAYKENVETVERDLSINIRYSVDKTGNPESGANWILESEEPAVSVRETYFTEAVLAWKGVLSGDISDAIKDNIDGNYSAYIVWDGVTKTYTVQQDFAWSSLNGATALDFIELGPNEIFDGAGKTIDISGLYIEGLFTSSATLFSEAPLVKNLGVLNGALNLDYSGIIIRQAQQYFKVDSCYSTAEVIDKMGAGGIVGGNYTEIIRDSSYSIINCYSTANISSMFAGGIVGDSAGYSGNCIISGCYSTGDINGQYAGGIAGVAAGSCNIDSVIPIAGNCSITNCYSLGDIIGPNAGGITGGFAGSTGSEVSNSNCSITNCYSLGDIMGPGAGGIAGSNAGAFVDGNCFITNCYSIGAINEQGAGGIVGKDSGNGGSCDISGCVSNGSPIVGTTSSVTETNNSTNLSVIDNSLYTGWPTDVWEIGGETPIVVLLPILTAFRTTPWSSVDYTKADDLAKFSSAPAPLIENSIPLRVNPYLAIGPVIVYTTAFVRALAAGTTLPNPGRTSWSGDLPTTGALLRPLGRSVTVFGENKLAIYRFENIQLINGPASEGVPADSGDGTWYTGWICIWAAGGSAALPVYP